MKVYISCDMEGVAGIADSEYVMRKDLDYGEGRELMLGEVNAAVEGALEAGATEAVINDSHGNMINLLPSKVHPKARLILGSVKPMSMMQGIDASFDAAALIGYHSMGGTQHGVLAHTYSGQVVEAKVNGVLFGEPEFNAALAGYYDVPVVFLSGDKAATREIGKHIPKIVTAAVKEGFGRRAAMSVHPEVARELIKEGMKRAIGLRKQIRPFKPKSPYRLMVTMSMSDMADMCERIPGVVRKGAKTLAFTDADYREVYKAFLTMMSMSWLAREE